MRCPFCKRTLAVTGRFCPYCGRQVFGRSLQSNEQQAPDTPPSEAPPQTIAPPVRQFRQRTQQPEYEDSYEDLFELEPSQHEASDTPARPTPPDIIDVDLEPEISRARSVYPTGHAGDEGPVQAPSVNAQGEYTEVKADGELVGKKCPYDQFELKLGDRVIVCPQCGTPHHVDCWDENSGCTTYGCVCSPTSSPLGLGGRRAAANARQTQVEQPGTYGPRVRTVLPSHLAQVEIRRQANNALICSFAGMFCCPIVALVSLVMAMNIFNIIGRNRFEESAAWVTALCATIISIVGILIWTIGLVINTQMVNQ